MSDFQKRTMNTNLSTRAVDDSELIIEGYFALFNNETELWPDAFEKIAPGAFDITGDIRALINHDTTLVIGRTLSKTLELSTDNKGLFGRIYINPNDTDAMNLYERVKRGDVTQCSFGFYVEDESVEYREDGSAHWTLEKVCLFEVSCCTFPAYADTGIEARQKQLDSYKKEMLEKQKRTLKERLK